jgi:hypothetical protein
VYIITFSHLKGGDVQVSQSVLDQKNLKSKYWGYVLEITCSSPEHAQELLSNAQYVQKYYGDELKPGPFAKITGEDISLAPHDLSIVKLIVPIEMGLKSIRLINIKGDEIITHRLKQND